MPSNELLILKSIMLRNSTRQYTQQVKEAKTLLNHPPLLLQAQTIHHQQTKPLFHQTFLAMVADNAKEPLTLVKDVERKFVSYPKK